MSTKAPSTRCAARNCHTSSLQLASAIRTRRVHFLNMTVEEAAVFAGLKADQWVSLESGWIPPLDNTLWIWWSLAGTLGVSADKLFNLANVDLTRNEQFAKESAA